MSALRDAFSDFKNEVRAAFGNIHEELKWLREKSDKNFERLSTKIDATNARIDAANQEVGQLAKSVTRTESTLDVLKWIWGAAGGLAGVFFAISTLNKFFHWYTP